MKEIRKIFCHFMGITGWVILGIIIWYAIFHDGLIYLHFNMFSEMWFEFFYINSLIVVMSIFTYLEVKEIMQYTKT